MTGSRCSLAGSTAIFWSARRCTVSRTTCMRTTFGLCPEGLSVSANLTCDRLSEARRAERLSWEAYHEGEDLAPRIEAYRRRFGCYPQSVHVDAIYRTRTNRAYCTERGIRSGQTSIFALTHHGEARGQRSNQHCSGVSGDEPGHDAAGSLLSLVAAALPARSTTANTATQRDRSHVPGGARPMLSRCRMIWRISSGSSMMADDCSSAGTNCTSSSDPHSGQSSGSIS